MTSFKLFRPAYLGSGNRPAFRLSQTFLRLLVQTKLLIGHCHEVPVPRPPLLFSCLPQGQRIAVQNSKQSTALVPVPFLRRPFCDGTSSYWRQLQWSAGKGDRHHASMHPADSIVVQAWSQSPFPAQVTLSPQAVCAAKPWSLDHPIREIAASQWDGFCRLVSKESSGRRFVAQRKEMARKSPKLLDNRIPNSHTRRHPSTE